MSDDNEVNRLSTDENPYIPTGIQVTEGDCQKSWFDATNEAITAFSLNLKQKQVLYLVARRLSGAISTTEKPLLIYCGGEGGTGKSRVIFAIHYLFQSENISGKYLPIIIVCRILYI